MSKKVKCPKGHNAHKIGIWANAFGEAGITLWCPKCRENFDIIESYTVYKKGKLIAMEVGNDK